jgi:hypothetical protein
MRAELLAASLTAFIRADAQAACWRSISLRTRGRPAPSAHIGEHLDQLRDITAEAAVDVSQSDAGTFHCALQRALRDKSKAVHLRWYPRHSIWRFCFRFLKSVSTVDSTVP